MSLVSQIEYPVTMCQDAEERDLRRVRPGLDLGGARLLGSLRGIMGLCPSCPSHVCGCGLAAIYRGSRSNRFARRARPSMRMEASRSRSFAMPIELLDPHRVA
jgi:hypothetical protein